MCFTVVAGSLIWNMCLLQWFLSLWLDTRRHEQSGMDRMMRRRSQLERTNWIDRSRMIPIVRLSNKIFSQRFPKDSSCEAFQSDPFVMLPTGFRLWGFPIGSLRSFFQMVPIVMVSNKIPLWCFPKDSYYEAFQSNPFVVLSKGLRLWGFPNDSDCEVIL